MSGDRWTVAVHEAGHVTVGLLLNCTVTSAALYGDGSGVTNFEGARSHRRAVLTCFGGHTAETLILPAADISPARSAGDFEKAAQHALAVAMTSDHLADARKARAAEARGPAEPAGPSILRTLTKAQLDAAIAKRVEALYARRVARAGKITKAARGSVHELLSSHLCVVRTIATALERYGELDQEQLLEVYELGRARQAEDDTRYGGRRT